MYFPVDTDRYAKTGSGLKILLLIFCANLPLLSCKREEKFPDLGTNFANPSDVAVSESSQYFYALNSDFDRTYNKGSILVLDKDGVRAGVTETNRLGRAMNVAGNDMIVVFDRSEVQQNPEARLFDLTDPKQPKLVKIFDLPCVPLNSVLRKDYKYFAVTCINGGLLVGELKTPREDSTLQLVREYDKTRRALHLDSARNLLFGFVTDMGKQDLFERVLDDVQTINDSTPTEGIPGADEVPDIWQTSKRLRSNTPRNEIFQFFVYDLAAEAAKGFPLVGISNADVQKELRWLYFCLSNFDGTPDPDGVCDGTDGGPKKKLYRTNFWEAKPDPVDPSAFYISHRGVGATLFANDVVKVSLTGNPRIGSDGVVPMTADFAKFERVYGFPGEVEADGTKADLHYPGDIEAIVISGRPMLVVNHFRDLVFWKKGEFRFGITAKVIGENSWFAETETPKDPPPPDKLTADPSTSYYQVAISPEGKGVSCSFYGNTVIMLDIAPGTDIKTRKLD